MMRRKIFPRVEGNHDVKSLVSFSLLIFAAAHATAAMLDSAALHDAAKYSATHRGASFLVIRNGKTLLEQYPGRVSADQPQRIYSGTKAFWNLAALAAAEDRILDLDAKVADTIPTWRKDPRKSQVTIRQLLDFSAGLAPGFGLQVNEYGDRDQAALRLPIVAKPGQAFIYGPAALQAFHQVLKQRLGDESPTHYLERRVLRRLELGPQRYLDDRAGKTGAILVTVRIVLGSTLQILKVGLGVQERVIVRIEPCAVELVRSRACAHLNLGRAAP